MCLQKVFHREWVKRRCKVVCCNGILDFLDFTKRGDHRFAVQNISHLLQGKSTAFNGKRGVDCFDAVRAAQLQCITLFHADDIALHQRGYLRDKRNRMGGY